MDSVNIFAEAVSWGRDKVEWLEQQLEDWTETLASHKQKADRQQHVTVAEGQVESLTADLSRARSVLAMLDQLAVYRVSIGSGPENPAEMAYVRVSRGEKPSTTVTILSTGAGWMPACASYASIAADIAALAECRRRNGVSL